jgi:hypothetical protein
MRSGLDDKYMDTLQNIEAAVVSVYDDRSDLIDYDVEEAYDALIDHYKRRARDQTPREPSMTEKPQAVYDVVKSVCDWRMGQSVASNPLGLPDVAPSPTRSPDELVSCLRQLKKSLQGWRKRGGRQGYLNFIDQFV